MDEPGDKKLVFTEVPVHIGPGFLVDYWQQEQSLPKLKGFELVRYYFGRAIHSIMSLPISNALAVMTVAVSLFLLGSFILTLQNLNEVITRAGSSLTVTVYIEDGVSQNALNEFVRELESNRGISSIEYVSKQRALELFRGDLGAQSAFLKGLETENPLPASLELQFVPDELGVQGVERSVEKIKKREIVSDVVFGSEWVERVQGLIKLFRALGVVTILMLFAIIIFLISNTIRLVIYSRRDEIEIMRLVGGTRSFVQIPFVIGGALQGLLGTFFGFLMLVAIYFLIQSELGHSNIISVILPSLKFLSTLSICFLFIGGVAVGAIGSYAALRKVVDV